MTNDDNLLNFDSRQILIIAENIAGEIGNAVYPVWRDGDGGDKVLIGTAFFVDHKNRTFLVTALHNFTKNKGVILKISVLGQTYSLNDMGNLSSDEDDLWVAEIPTELKEFTDNIKLPSLRRKSPEACRFGTGTVMIGFPDSLNPAGKSFKALPISTALETRKLETTNSLIEKVVIDLRGDQLFTAGGIPVMDMPQMFGMSGGPAFSWYATLEPASKQISLHYFLQGMIVAWQRRDLFVTACNAARIENLVSTFSSIETKTG